MLQRVAQIIEEKDVEISINKNVRKGKIATKDIGKGKEKVS